MRCGLRTCRLIVCFFTLIVIVVHHRPIRCATRMYQILCTSRSRDPVEAVKYALVMLGQERKSRRRCPHLSEQGMSIFCYLDLLDPCVLGVHGECMWSQDMSIDRLFLHACSYSSPSPSYTMCHSDVPDPPTMNWSSTYLGVC